MVAFGRCRPRARRAIAENGSAEREARGLMAQGQSIVRSYGEDGATLRLVEAYVDIGVKKFGAEKEIPIYEDRFTYPGAELEFGECPDG